jgi:6-phosphogluconolactonase
LDKDGALTGPLQTIGFTGKGLLPDRQSSPHAHAAVVSPDGNHLLVTDLGTDRILIYEIDRKTGSLSAAAEPYLPVHAGAGPRHLAFHPNGKYLYLSEELSGTIGVFAYGAGKLKLMQTISTVAEDYKGQFSVSHLQCAPDGRFLYAGNRATANTIVVYAIDPSGILSVVQHQPVSGIKPRHFNISPDGAELWVANQSSHEVVVFNRNAQSGLLSESGRRIKIPSPACLLWLK